MLSATYSAKLASEPSFTMPAPEPAPTGWLDWSTPTKYTLLDNYRLSYEAGAKPGTGASSGDAAPPNTVDAVAAATNSALPQPPAETGLTLASKKFPVGSIATRVTGGFKLAIPVGTTLSGLGAEASYLPVGVSQTLPDGVKLVSDKEFAVATGERQPFFRTNNPLMWVALGTGAAAIGGGLWWYMRRR